MKVITNGKKLSSYFPFRMTCEQGCGSKLLIEGPEDIYPYRSYGMQHASDTSCAVQCPICKEWNYFNMDGYPEFVWKAVVKINKGRKMCPYPRDYRHHSKEYAGNYP